MRVFVFKKELWLPRQVDQVFPFFADARNLERITPPWLQFSVLDRGPIHMASGTRINYQLRMRGIPIRWQSEITIWEPPVRFVDQQRRGPYRLWIHEHRFVEKNGGTMAFDEVKYAVPGGSVVNRLFVSRDVEKIFDYRSQKLKEIFSR
ncbi:MAG: SRPBCC family protein [Candidatus Krumholzibacteria bacterium]|nr:SRPBCC family protein [Candidatus Krumholzibacteria bacterium]